MKKYCLLIIYFILITFSSCVLLADEKLIIRNTKIFTDIINNKSNILVNNKDIKIIQIIGNLTEKQLTYIRNLKSIFPKIEAIELPNQTGTLSANKFSNIEWLKSFSAPKVQAVGNNCFRYCIALENINFPKVESIGENCFEYCMSLNNIRLPKVTFLGSYCFSYCFSLKLTDLSQVENVSEGCFWECKSLEKIDLPKAKRIGISCFNSCLSLDSINLPSATVLGSYCFANSPSISSITFGADIYYYGNSMFYDSQSQRNTKNITLYLLNKNEYSEWANYGCGLWPPAKFNVTRYSFRDIENNQLIIDIKHQILN